MRTYFSLPIGILPPRPIEGLVFSGASPEEMLATDSTVRAVSDYRGFVASGLWDLSCPELAGRDHVLVAVSVLLADRLVVRMVSQRVWHFSLSDPDRVRSLRVPDQFPLWPLVVRARGFVFDDSAILFPPTFLRARVADEVARQLDL